MFQQKRFRSTVVCLIMFYTQNYRRHDIYGNNLLIEKSKCIHHWTPPSCGADSMGHEGACPPHFYKWLSTGGNVSRRTANKKLTKLYMTTTKTLTKTTNCTFKSQKVEGHDHHCFPALCTGPVPPPLTFKFVPALLPPSWFHAVNRLGTAS